MNILEEKVKNRLRKQGYTIFDNGFPDLLTMKDGIYQAIEVKNKRDKLRKNQLDMLLALDNAGIESFIYRHHSKNTFAMISINDFIINNGDMKIRPFKTKWRGSWEKGREHFLFGIDSFKDMGMSYQQILNNIKSVLSIHERADAILLGVYTSA